MKTGTILPSLCSVGELFFQQCRGINVQQSVDTSVIPSKATAQSGLYFYAAPPATERSHLLNVADIAGLYGGHGACLEAQTQGAGGANTLNMDTLGAITVKQADGVTIPQVRTLSPAAYTTWHDGTVFRSMTPVVNVATPASQPACSASQRGRFWQTLGGTGVKDAVTVCAKDAADAYAWSDLLMAHRYKLGLLLLLLAGSVEAFRRSIRSARN